MTFSFPLIRKQYQSPTHRQIGLIPAVSPRQVVVDLAQPLLVQVALPLVVGDLLLVAQLLQLLIKLLLLLPVGLRSGGCRCAYQHCCYDPLHRFHSSSTLTTTAGAALSKRQLNVMSPSLSALSMASASASSAVSATM